MKAEIRWIFAIADAQKAALAAALENVSGDFYQEAATHARKLIRNSDPDGSAAIGWITAVTCERILWKRKDDTPGPVKQAILDAGAAVSSYEEHVLHWAADLPPNRFGLNAVDNWLEERPLSLRRDGFHWGLARADGSAAAQATSTSPVIINQWTEAIDLIGMGQYQGLAFNNLEPLPNPYTLSFRLHFAPVLGVTFGFRLRLFNGSSWISVGDEVTSDDGTVHNSLQGTIPATGYRVALAARSTSPSNLKLLNGSMMRLTGQR